MKKNYSIILLYLLLHITAQGVFAGPGHPAIRKDSTAGVEFDELFIINEAKRMGMSPTEATYYLANIKSSYLNRTYKPFEADEAAPEPPMLPGTLPDCSNAFENNQFAPWKASSFFTYADGVSQPVRNITDTVQKTGRQSICRDPQILDPIGKFPIVAPRWSKEPGGENHYSLKLGNRMVGSEGETATIEYETTNNFIVYSYAVVLQDPEAMNGSPSHPDDQKPFFEVKIYVDNILVKCGSLKIVAGSGLYGFFYTEGGAYLYKPWTRNVINCEDQLSIPDGTLKNVRMEFTTSDCTLGGHFGYAYVDVGCIQPQIKRSGRSCVGAVNSYSCDLFGNYKNETIKWEFFDSNTTTTAWDRINYIQGDIVNAGGKVKTITGSDFADYSDIDIENPKYSFMSQGEKKVVLTVVQKNPVDGDCSISLRTNRFVDNCRGRQVRCKECISSFAPLPGNKYLLSAWVREETIRPVTYTEPGIYLTMNGPGTTLGPFKPGGRIIDGWQKIEQEFFVPEGTYSMEMVLKNTDSLSSAPVYFDDIRVLPFKGSMKSYVYDPYSQKLVAELDENNYATFYEYNEEGSLVRVKKETARGVMTIKENGNNLKQVNP